MCFTSPLFGVIVSKTAFEGARTLYDKLDATPAATPPHVATTSSVSAVMNAFFTDAIVRRDGRRSTRDCFKVNSIFLTDAHVQLLVA